MEKVGFTQEELDREFYGGMYAANPDLETRVRQYKGILDQLGLDEYASMDEIKAVATASANILDAAAFILEAIAVYDAIITNLEGCGADQPHMAAFEMLPKLIQYLPVVGIDDVGIDGAEGENGSDGENINEIPPMEFLPPDESDQSDQSDSEAETTEPEVEE